MQAIVYHRYGPPDVLEYKEVGKPTPAHREVLVEVRAASVNPYDWHFLRGTPSFIRLFTGLQGPESPRLGADVSDVVAAGGPGVTRFKPRRRSSLSAVTEAIRYVESCHARGKVTITVER